MYVHEAVRILSAGKGPSQKSWKLIEPKSGEPETKQNACQWKDFLLVQQVQMLVGFAWNFRTLTSWYVSVHHGMLQNLLSGTPLAPEGCKWIHASMLKQGTGTLDCGVFITCMASLYAKGCLSCGCLSAAKWKSTQLYWCQHNFLMWWNHSRRSRAWSHAGISSSWTLQYWCPGFQSVLDWMVSAPPCVWVMTMFSVTCWLLLLLYSQVS
jgi:hypothetical protein